MMADNKFDGTGVATITPFRDGAIDEVALDQIVKFQIDAGVDYLVCLGTTGEASTLSDEEKMRVQRCMLRTNNNRLPFVLGIFGGNHTASQIRSMQAWDLTGVNALLCASPAYVKPSQQGLYEHFRALADASPLPLIIYNVPGRTAKNMKAETILRLAHDCPNIIGVKEASADLMQGSSIIKSRPDGFLVMSGDDPTALGLMACGGNGVISVIANAFPREMSQMVRLALANDFQQARKIHLDLLSLHHWLYVEGNPVGVKAAMQIMGFCSREVRLPLAQLSDPNFRKLQDELERFESSIGQ